MRSNNTNSEKLKSKELKKNNENNEIKSNKSNKSLEMKVSFLSSFFGINNKNFLYVKTKIYFMIMIDFFK